MISLANCLTWMLFSSSNRVDTSYSLYSLYAIFHCYVGIWYLTVSCPLPLFSSFCYLLLFTEKKTSNHKKSYFLTNQLSQRIPNARSQSNWIWMFIPSIRWFLSFSFMIFVECSVSFIYISFRTNRDLYWIYGTYCAIKPQYKITYTFGFGCILWPEHFPLTTTLSSTWHYCYYYNSYFVSNWEALQHSNDADECGLINVHDGNCNIENKPHTNRRNKVAKLLLLSHKFGVCDIAQVGNWKT